MIIKIENVFTNEERKKLIKDCNPLLVDGKELGIFYNKKVYPGKQTHPTLHLHPNFTWAHNHILNLIQEKTKLNLEVIKSWILCTRGKATDQLWHKHNADYACVYYMRVVTPYDTGTFFRNGFFPAKQNSLILFPAHLEHSAPASYFRFKRYTMALNLNSLTK